MTLHPNFFLTLGRALLSEMVSREQRAIPIVTQASLVDWATPEEATFTIPPCPANTDLSSAPIVLNTLHTYAIPLRVECRGSISPQKLTQWYEVMKDLVFWEVIEGSNWTTKFAHCLDRLWVFPEVSCQVYYRIIGDHTLPDDREVCIQFLTRFSGGEHAINPHLLPVFTGPLRYPVLTLMEKGMLTNPVPVPVMIAIHKKRNVSSLSLLEASPPLPVLRIPEEIGTKKRPYRKRKITFEKEYSVEPYILK